MRPPPVSSLTSTETIDLGLEQVVMPIGLDLNTKLETQIRIVQSDTIATSVIKQLGLTAQ